MRMRLSVFTKVFIVFLAVISPLYGLSIYINNVWRNQTKIDLYDSRLNNIDFYVSNIEQEVKKMVDNVVVLINSADISVVAELQEIPYEYGLFRQIERIQKELASVKSSCRFIQESYVLFPLSGIKLTERSRLTMADSDYKAVLDGRFYTGFPFINYSDGVYINFSSEFHREFPPVEKIKYVIVTKIDMEKITYEMNEYFTGEADKLCFIGETNGISLNSGISEDIVNEIAEFLDSLTQTKNIERLTLKTANTDLLVGYCKSAYLKTTFVLFTEERHFLNTLKAYSNWAWILTGTSIVLLIIFSLWMRSIIAVPINRLIEAIGRGIAGNLDNVIEYKANEEFMYIYEKFNEMLKAHHAAILQMYRQEILIKDTELKMLQYQINPHFLYNSFFIMYQMLEASEYDALQKMMLHMGNYFNFITKSESFISLKEEMRFCMDYIGMQSIRFSNRITAEIEPVPEEWSEKLVPRIFIQPLLENCYKHGLVNKEQGGLIYLRFILDRQLIIIEDNGNELTDEELLKLQGSLNKNDSSGTYGMCNVHKRLQAYYGEQYGLSLHRSELGGLLVQISVLMKD